MRWINLWQLLRKKKKQRLKRRRKKKPQDLPNKSLQTFSLATLNLYQPDLVFVMFLYLTLVINAYMWDRLTVIKITVPVNQSRFQRSKLPIYVKWCFGLMRWYFSWNCRTPTCTGSVLLRLTMYVAWILFPCCKALKHKFPRNYCQYFRKLVIGFFSFLECRKHANNYLTNGKRLTVHHWVVDARRRLLNTKES